MPRRAVVHPRFATELRRLRQERNLSLRDLAARSYVAKSTISDLENGAKSPTLATTRALDKALADGDVLVGMVSETSRPATFESGDDGGDEEQALEMSRRVAASDVGAETLTQIEAGVDDLATAYPKTPSGELLRRVRRHLGYVDRLFEARKTLDEHRRLIVAAGWLSLLAATLHVDLHRRPLGCGSPGRWVSTRNTVKSMLVCGRQRGTR